MKPCVAARAVVMKDQKILLVNGDGGGDLWVLPGGRMNYGENLKAACKREVYEETGLVIETGNAFCVDEFFADESAYHVVNIFFYCKVLDGDLPDSWVDTDGPVISGKFFTLADLQNINASPKWLKDGEWLAQESSDIYRGQGKKE